MVGWRGGPGRRTSQTILKKIWLKIRIILFDCKSATSEPKTINYWCYSACLSSLHSSASISSTCRPVKQTLPIKFKNTALGYATYLTTGNILAVLDEQNAYYCFSSTQSLLEDFCLLLLPNKLVGLKISGTLFLNEASVTSLDVENSFQCSSIENYASATGESCV